MERQPQTELSSRQIQILSLSASGLCYKEIASELFTSEGTVKHWTEDIARSLEVGSTAQAVFKAAKLGMIDLERATLGLNLKTVRSLTPRELETLKVMTSSSAGGNKDIAQSMGISEKSVKNHVTNALSKLFVETRIQAGLVYLAAERKGLISSAS